MEIRQLFNYIKTPHKFENSPDNIWTNEKLSSLVMNSYFDSSIYGGSYSKEFRNESLDFINQFLQKGSVLDIGCGPGLYSNKLAKLNYSVTGIDISQSAIKYAQKYAKEKDIKVNFEKSDIFSYTPTQNYNNVLLIYYIYSFFSSSKRKILLKKIYNLLENKGTFILDVPSINYYNKLNEIKLWDYFPISNNFMEEEFLSLFNLKKYGDGLLLNQTIYILEDSNIAIFDWLQHFDLEGIKAEINQAGFTIVSERANIAGSKYDSDSNSIAIVCQKIE